MSATSAPAQQRPGKVGATRRNLFNRAVMVLFLLTAGKAVEADAASRSPETDLTAPGAPLYEQAVTESIKGLMSKQEQAELGVEGRPPSPGPGYYWCENHKTYHQRETPASAQQPAAAPGSVGQPEDATATRPPSPGPDYYWCENHKSYHQRQAVPNQPGAPGRELPGALSPDRPPAAGPGTGSRPPSPGEGHYWCENCKTYHLRQTSAQQPDGSPAVPHTHAEAPGVGTVAGQAAGDYYYCENCKTYHRRQPVGQQPAAHPSHIFQGTSNSLNLSPLFSPPQTNR